MFNARRRGAGDGGGGAAYTPMKASNVDGNTYSTEYIERDGNCVMFMESLLGPVGRKIQNLVYGIALGVMTGVGVAYVDTGASFQLYYSPVYDPSKAVNLQIEWLSVIFAATGVAVSLWKVINFSGSYEEGVASGFCPLNWIDAAISGAAILCQLFIMECDGVSSEILFAAFLWFSVVIILGLQEDTNSVYESFQLSKSQSSVDSDVDIEVRRKRTMHYLLSWIPLLGLLALLASQAAYDGIKGTVDPPDFLKAYIAVTIFMVFLISGNSAWNIIRVNSSRSQGEKMRSHAKKEVIFILLMFLWKVESIAFVFKGMRDNNNLSYCGSTPLQTIN